MDYTYDKLNIVYEDNHLLVVVKPNNVPSQGDETGDKDMGVLLKEYLKDKYNKQGNVYLGTVHRLDRPTGGVMVYAKTDKAAARLSQYIRTGEFEKKYLAVVENATPAEQGVLKNYLYKFSRLNIVKVVPDATEGAKAAELSYTRLAEKVLTAGEASKTVSLVKVNLETGISHQIRVQMAYIGNPLVGDSKYGSNKSKNPFPLALWAYELRFPHPITKQTMVFRVFPDCDVLPWKWFDLKSILHVTIRD